MSIEQNQILIITLCTQYTQKPLTRSFDVWFEIKQNNSQVEHILCVAGFAFVSHKSHNANLVFRRTWTQMTHSRYLNWLYWKLFTIVQFEFYFNFAIHFGSLYMFSSLCCFTETSQTDFLGSIKPAMSVIITSSRSKKYRCIVKSTSNFWEKNTWSVQRNIKSF